MLKTRILAFTISTIMMVGPSFAASCYNLWYERNQIYDDNGFCFKTALGKRTFDNSDCYTSHVNLSSDEQDQVDSIVAEERRKHCHVN